MAQVTIHNLRKNYGELEVLHGIGFDVEDGEFLALVGPSGCGKSTLLRMVAGLEDISSGTISIGGRVVNDVAPKERDIAMVFQNYALYPHMTVAQNMGFSMRLRGGAKADIAARVKDTAAILGLSEFLERMPAQLSGGQRQRVAMGRAIVRQPSVFLFDEPLSNLDASLRVQMRAEIRSLHDRLSSTSIFVTHDQVEAMTMSDRIAVIREGVVEQIGLPLDLYDYPANAFVASFIGSPAMNITNAQVADGRIKIGASSDIVAATSIAGPVQWGVRPEHLSLVSADAADAITVTVSNVESTGNAELVMAMADGFNLNAQFTERHGIKKGDRIGLVPRSDKTHLFDIQSGVRLG